MRAAIFSVIAASLMLLPRVAAAQDACTQMSPSIGFNSANFFQLSGAYHPALGQAADSWNSACDSMVPFFNPFSSQPSSIPVNMHLSTSWVENPCGAECGCTSQMYSGSGEVLSAEVWAFEYGADGLSCGDYEQLIAHELGHLLGFQNVGFNCLGRIMYGNFPAPGASPGFTECFAANVYWTTDWESSDPCDWPDTNEQTCGNQGGGSPILLDLDRNGFHLVGLDEAVLFDLDSDGDPEFTTWTQGGQLDAFLWLDRNENGEVDDGRELFGTETLLRNGGRAPNGYVALAEFDTAFQGGNGDGYIDGSDEVFERLRLWVDLDHDGLSDSDEIHSLTERDVTRIRLFYRRSLRRDQHGNLFRYLSRAWLRVGSHSLSMQTTDVFFVDGS